ncbi:MAG: CHAT domain-containing protein [Anaerolineae bacterium]|nr:CHAT domain-containing protein [Anaerolineae bacterium]MDW8099961.1 CHAT domain-containing protein [Anaerolineae bacterium]
MPEEIQARKAARHIEEIIAALQKRWGELSPAEQVQVERLYMAMRYRYQQASDPVDYHRGRALVEFLQGLDAIAGVRAIVGTLLDATKGPAIRGGSIRSDPQLLQRLPTRLGPEPTAPHLTRYPQIVLSPTRPRRGQKADLLVLLLREPPDPGAEPIFVLDTGEPNQPPKLEISLDVAGCEIEGDHRQTLPMHQDADDETRFVLTLREVGEQPIEVTFTQEGQWLGSVYGRVTIGDITRSARPPKIEELEPMRSEHVETAPEVSAEPQRPLLRYPELECQEQVILHQRFSLFVRLLIQPSEPGVEAIAIEDTGTPELPEVEVVVRARGFDVEGGDTRTIRVERERDTEERFVLIPRRLGEQEIRVDFYQHGRYLGTARRRVLVVEQITDAATSQPESPIILELKAAPTVEPPDLELRVIQDYHDERVLYFELHSSKEVVGYHHFKSGEVKLRGSPLEKMQAVYQELSQMAGKAPPTTEARAYAERRLAAIGNGLWDELVPDRLKEQYWEFRSRVKSILITSDEPWVPWEAIKPYRYKSDGEREDDPFWCQQFAIARWLSGPGLADALPVGAARPVAPVQVNLPSVREEVAFVERLSDLRPGIISLAAFNSRLQVLDWLQTGEFSLVHFACHGQFDSTLPQDSAIILSDGALRPSDIRTRFGGKRPRPLIFINACHGAREEFSFTGLGGWAQQLVARARVGAFIGAMWEVNDALALQFARCFYTALLKDNKPIAQAFQEAREQIRQAAPWNSTWLAYVLYADPEGRLGEGG